MHLIMMRYTFFGLIALLPIAVPGTTSRAGGAEGPALLIDRGVRAPAFLVVRRDRGAVRADQLDNVTVCGRPNGGLVQNAVIEDHFARHGAGFTMAMYETGEDQNAAFTAGACDVVAIYDYYDVARANRDFDPETYIAFPLKP